MKVEVIVNDKELCGNRFEKENQPQVIWCNKSNEGWMENVSESKIKEFPFPNRLFLWVLKLLWDILCK